MIRVFRALLLLAALVLWQAAAMAVQPDEILQDAALEARARTISAGLRCLVCQNQSIDDSDAPLARDLRVLVRERLQAGDSDADVLNFVAARYGEFALLRPRFAPHTALLWLGPLLLLLGGILLAYRLFGHSIAGEAAPRQDLSEAEQAKLKTILDERR